MIVVILLVVFIFSALVIAHEWGHYFAAKRNGVKVLEFGIGFPPKLVGKKRKDTVFSINALPIGGFVRLKGEDGEDMSKDSFASQNAWTKTKILMAGVSMNLIIAYFLITILLWAGIPPLINVNLPSFGPVQPQTTGEANLTVLQVTKGSAAESAGLKPADEIISLNGETISNFEDLSAKTKQLAGQQVEVSYRRGGNLEQKTIVLGTDEGAGILGVVADKIQLSRYNWWQAPIAAVFLTLQLIAASLIVFANLIVGLFTRAEVSQNVAGPIGIVSIFTNLIDFGWRYIVAFIASISLSLAVINALPIPALDGGRELIVLLKKAGIAMSPKRENMVHFLGFAILILLIIIISASDISRL